LSQAIVSFAMNLQIQFYPAARFFAI
jgi:hypothetical protein